MSLGPRAYITYFDQHYLVRAIVMLRSLRRHDPDATIFAFCFDQTAYKIIASLQDRKIVPVTLQTIWDFEPSLLKCTGRTHHAFLATHKPVLPLYVLSKHPEFAAFVHIDADIYFFSSPEPLFAEIGQASIAISPHRPGKNVEYVLRSGKFNAGLIYWRNEPVGRRCLADYREDCLRWCDETIQPDGRWMNQGYLTKWPERYPGVHVIRHPGVNLAPWNVTSHSLSGTDAVTVDGVSLIFYHFSNLVLDPQGIWRTILHEFGDHRDLVLKAIYGPYLDEVEQTEQWLLRQVPELPPLQRSWKPEAGLAVRRGPWPRSWRGRIGRVKWLISQLA